MGRTRRFRRKKQLRGLEKVFDLCHDAGHIELMRFMHRNGWEDHCELRVGIFSSTGRGLYSKRRVEARGELIKVPRKLLITLETLEMDAQFKAAFGEVKNVDENSKLPFQGLLAAYLCFQKRQNNSFWANYLNSLPKKFTNPYFCEKRELHFLPEIVLEAIVAQNDAIKKSFEILTTHLKETFLTLDEFKWAYFVVNSRSVYIRPDFFEADIFKEILKDSHSMALIPLLDLFNHSNEADTEARFVDNHYEILTKVPTQTYKQIFINYGSLNNLKFFVEYGFILPKNCHDFVDLKVDDVVNLIKLDPELKTVQIPRQKFQFIKDHNLNDQLFFDTIDGISHNLSVILYLVFIEKKIFNLTQIAFGDIIDPIPIKKYALKLIDFKIQEFTNFKKCLIGLDILSESGKVCLQYYDECIALMNKSKEIIL